MKEKTVDAEVVNEKALSTEVTPMDLLQQANKTGANIDQLSKLMELQFQWEENQAIKAYNKAIKDFKSENIEIFKTTRVDYEHSRGRTTYKHAKLPDIIDQIINKLSKYGLNHSWRMEQPEQGNKITVYCRISHVDGHYEETRLSAEPDTSGGKNSIQAIGSTVTYLERYTLKAALGLAEKDDDAKDVEKEDCERVNDDQIYDLECKIKDAGKTVEGFCKYYKIASIDQLPASKYNDAAAVLAKGKK